MANAVGAFFHYGEIVFPIGISAPAAPITMGLETGRICHDPDQSQNQSQWDWSPWTHKADILSPLAKTADK
jgi:hypothetical protein